LRYQASFAAARGARAEARDLYEKSRAIYKELGDEIALRLVLANIGEFEFAEGNYQGALRAVSDALAWSQSRGVDKSALANSNVNRAAYLIALDDRAGARTSAREALRVSGELQDPYTTAISVQHCALLGALQGQAPSAARLLGYVDQQYKELGTAREPTEKWCYDRLLASLREKLSKAEIEKLEVEGAAWSEDQAVEEALKV
jgi:hypothetical protein